MTSWWSSSDSFARGLLDIKRKIDLYAIAHPVLRDRLEPAPYGSTGERVRACG
jgi:hypothetical protein